MSVSPGGRLALAGGRQAPMGQGRSLRQSRVSQAAPQGQVDSGHPWGHHRDSSAAAGSSFMPPPLPQQKLACMAFIPQT